jgi:hypothetical protein
MEQILECLLALQDKMRTNQVKMKAKIGAEMEIVHNEIMNANQEK